MIPVFTLQWPEFIVATRLQDLLPKNAGYSILIPLSPQEKGFDLAVLHRKKAEKSKTITIQIKASRSYLHSQPKRIKTNRFKYGSWFNKFGVSDRADYVIFVIPYAPDLGKTTRVSAKWYQYCLLLFSRYEIQEFLLSCKTVGGNPDRHFSFGFNNIDKVVLTRGDKNRSNRDYSKYLLKKRISELKRHL